MKKILKPLVILILTLSYSTNTFSAENTKNTHKKEDINQKLYYAIRSNNLSLVKNLVSKGAEVNQSINISSDYKKVSPLIIACYIGNIEIVKFLSSKKININHRDANGCSALTIAAVMKNLQIANLLIDRGADMSVKTNDLMPLLILVSLGTGNDKISDRQKMIELFIKKGADVNIKNQKGVTALWLNALDDNQEMVSFLIKHGANPNIRDKEGSTLLSEVALDGKKDILELLLKNKSDVNAKDEKGHTVLDYMKETKQTEIIKLLQKYGSK